MVDLYGFDKVRILLAHLNTSNLCGWPIFQKLPTDGLKKVDDFTPANTTTMVKKEKKVYSRN